MLVTYPYASMASTWDNRDPGQRDPYGPMGGIFGVNNRVFLPKYRDKVKPIPEIIQDNYKYYKERNYNVDQLFLNNFIWNLPLCYFIFEIIQYLNLRCIRIFLYFYNNQWSFSPFFIFNSNN